MENPYNDEELLRQIMNLTRRVHTLEKEVEILKEQSADAQITATKAVTPIADAQITGSKALTTIADAQITATKAETPMAEPQIVREEASAAESKAQGRSENVTANMDWDRKTAENPNKQSSPLQNNKLQNNKMRDNESRIGKNLMAIVASVLILFSIILFGGLIIPYITDPVRYAIMLIFSLAFAIVGIINMKKESKLNALFSAVAAVGVCGFYISNLIGYLGFHILTEIMLLILIGVWLAAMIVLGRLKSGMFLVICNIGLIISALLATKEWSSIYLGVFVYFIGILALFLVNKKEDFNKDSYLFIQIPIMSWVFMAFYHESWQIFVLMLLVSLVFVLPLFIYMLEEKHLVLMLVSYVLMCFTMLIASVILLIDNVEYGAVFTVIMLLQGLILRVKCRHKLKALAGTAFYVMMFSLSFLNFVILFREYIGFVGIAILLLAIGYIKGNIKIRYSGFAYLLLCLFFLPGSIPKVLCFILLFVVIAALFILSYVNYNVLDKYFCLALTGIYLYQLLDLRDFSQVFYFTAFSLITIFVNSPLFIKNPKTKEEERPAYIISYVFMGFALLFGGYILLKEDMVFSVDNADIISEGLSFVIVFLLSLLLCIQNVRRILASKLPSMLAGCYTCFKFTVLLLLVLHRFRVASFGLTFSTLVFAVICIVAGFIKRYKPFRIYGLVLTLISVLKLVLFDIQYDSNLLRPLGFLAAGLLCFGISWIYAKIERGSKEKE